MLLHYKLTQRAAKSFAALNSFHARNGTPVPVGEAPPTKFSDDDAFMMHKLPTNRPCWNAPPSHQNDTNQVLLYYFIALRAILGSGVLTQEEKLKLKQATTATPFYSLLSR